MKLPATVLFGFACQVASATVSSSSYHNDAGVLQYVNPKIGTYGITPNGDGGMIPSTSPPFGMTRWTPQTRENFISQCPYNELDQHIHGFQATHQPAIWMGESGQVVLVPGVGAVEPLFTRRGHVFAKSDEKSTPYVYEVVMDAQNVVAGENLTESIYSPVSGGQQAVPDTVRKGANGRTRRDEDGVSDGAVAIMVNRAGNQVSLNRGGGNRLNARNGSKIRTAMTATSHVGFLRFDFPTNRTEHQTVAADGPYVFLQATRQNWTGSVTIDPKTKEIYGSNPQRQDYALGPFKAKNFRGYFVSRFSTPFVEYGVSNGGQVTKGQLTGNGTHLGAYVRFPPGTGRVQVRTGVSFVSIEQARRNLDLEVPDKTSFEQVVNNLKNAWLEKLGRVQIEGVNKTDSDHDQRTVWYTGLFHSLQYPSDFSEPLSSGPNGARTFYEGYTDRVHQANDSYYQSWSIWDTFRAEHSILTLFAPERVNSMMRSLLRIYDWAGRLPMWANLVETNIMVGTHVDAVLANALARGFRDFNISKAWEGVRKNAFVPPDNDTDLLYYDREGNTPQEVRAGLTSYMSRGWVANDGWSESAARTLDYAFDDWAASVVAQHAGDNATAATLRKRSSNYRHLYNANTTFMEARNANGTWAGSDQGWTEGDDWIYTFNVMHDPLGLASLMGGASRMVQKLDSYFAGGHNDQSNEPSHHAPYLYAAIGHPASTQRLTRTIANQNYNATAAGLSGNEDLGQMSAWFLFSALGFYPLNPASDEYVVGSPFFEKVSIRLPAGAATGGRGGGAGVGSGTGTGNGTAAAAAAAEEHTLTISAPGAPTKPYVAGLKVDGTPVSSPVLRHAQLVTARRIEFAMAATPQVWGSGMAASAAT